MKRRFNELPYETQARLRIPDGYLVVKGDERPRGSDLVWSCFTQEFIRADSQLWLRSPLEDKIDDCTCVVRAESEISVVECAPAAKVYTVRTTLFDL